MSTAVGIMPLMNEHMIGHRLEMDLTFTRTSFNGKSKNML